MHSLFSVSPVGLRWILRTTVTLLVGAAAVLAWQQGGGADARVLPPQPAAAAAAKEPADRGHGAEAFEVATRLIDKLAEARIDVPGLGAAQQSIQAYWRKMRVPWVPLSGIAGQMALTIAMRTSRDLEAQWAVPVPGGDTWVPEARVWNMNEGSFDQREAIFAPAPATVAFTLDLPPAARLRLSPAVLSPMPTTTVFDVTLTDSTGVEHALSQTRIAGTDAKRWLDVDVESRGLGWTESDATSGDLERQAGGGHEKRWMPVGPDEADAGASEVSLFPSTALALWGDPVVVAKEPTRVPYDVLWIVVDALRPDVAASMHDPDEDAAELAAPQPPLEARLPAIPGLMPGIDHLASARSPLPARLVRGGLDAPGHARHALRGALERARHRHDASGFCPAARSSHYYGTEPPARAAHPARERRRDRGFREQLLHGRIRLRRPRHGLRARDRPPLSQCATPPRSPTTRWLGSMDTPQAGSSSS